MNINANNTKEIHISEIRVGDTIIHDGIMRTVCGRVLKSDTFMGTTLFGDSYKSGHKLVTKVTYVKF